MSAVRVSSEVAQALRERRPVVALETTIVAHGFPSGEGVEVGRACEAAVREGGAVPATVGMIDGSLRVGLEEAELGRFTPAARKVGPRELGICSARRQLGATTVGATLAACRIAGVRFMATGGLGGVHRGLATHPDISADLVELARTPALVVCSGVKSLLDVEATAELLETASVPVLGFRTDELPLFYQARGGPGCERVEEAAEAAHVAAAHWSLGAASAVVLAQPPASEVEDMDELIAAALADAERDGVTGQGVTPRVLASLHERSGGRTQAVNRQLAIDNARLAGQVAAAFAALEH
ncbi:MAG TPA: pseudouridine-5'-phosphate glycosidase [Solirubrobacteraceae bacterium]|nr:pseudouridine-5'-phosphate glycosidase [Solirubrobacteraceae bacterium]